MIWGRTYLWIAILIFAAAASVVASLVEIGEANLIDGRNPISFCNLLFAGNLVAALTLFALNHREWSPTHLRALSRRQWLIQTALALTSGAIAPAMMFTAIAHTSVTNIVLIETIEIPLGLLLAWLLYREKSNWTAVLGALCAPPTLPQRHPSHQWPVYSSPVSSWARCPCPPSSSAAALSSWGSPLPCGVNCAPTVRRAHPRPTTRPKPSPASD